nr:immunoglobulin heavy chain junction region [Macaca mulatta]MOW45691.1 immunoglobulin heavy chain junction region [Macaca mulatta]MOW46086.1 immunoglobulin heavy chain junction region [Macaca mulatta]MOW46273.1 immunoglobulin heavy chain junction region [Macaca mulatta]MOW46274.1 immunoglobulin heavy chain junction region [Macaca mulatta]
CARSGSGMINRFDVW